MSVLLNNERIDREIFKIQNGRVVLAVNSTILSGKKGANDVKLDPIYKRSYSSQKYSDKSELETIKLTSSDYISFSYNDFDNKKQEEVFISYPNMYDLKEFCNECMNLLNDKSTFDSKNQVSMKAKDISISSTELAGGKILVMIPASLERDQNIEKGMYLFINEEDYYVELDYKAMYTLNEIIQSIDLLTLSNQTLILGILGNLDGIEGGSSSSSNSFSRAPKSPLGNRPSFPKRNNNQFGKNISKPTNNDEEDTTIEEADENVFDNSEEDTTPPSTTPKKNNFSKAKTGASSLKGRSIGKKSSSPVTSGGEGFMNFNNLMNEANQINFDGSDDEEDVNFDE